MFTISRLLVFVTWIRIFLVAKPCLSLQKRRHIMGCIENTSCIKPFFQVRLFHIRVIFVKNKSDIIGNENIENAAGMISNAMNSETAAEHPDVWNTCPGLSSNRSFPTNNVYFNSNWFQFSSFLVAKATIIFAIVTTMERKIHYSTVVEMILRVEPGAIRFIFKKLDNKKSRMRSRTIAAKHFGKDSIAKLNLEMLMYSDSSLK